MAISKVSGLARRRFCCRLGLLPRLFIEIFREGDTCGNLPQGVALLQGGLEFSIEGFRGDSPGQVRQVGHPGIFSIQHIFLIFFVIIFLGPAWLGKQGRVTK